MTLGIRHVPLMDRQLTRRSAHLAALPTDFPRSCGYNTKIERRITFLADIIPKIFTDGPSAYHWNQSKPHDKSVCVALCRTH